MKMNSPHNETPEELRGITEVLEKSLRPQSEEEIPPMPDDLRKRLQGQYSEEEAQVLRSTTDFWSQLKSLFAQPAFSGSLAALVLVGVLMSFLLRPDPADPVENMRGNPTSSLAYTAIILFDLDETQQAAVVESGYFDEKHLHIATAEDEVSDWIARDGETIVIDGAAGEIRHEDGRQLPMPSSEAEIADIIADLLAK